VERKKNSRMDAAQALDWSAPELLDALQAEGVNGFGFQCDSPQSRQPTRIYIAKPFNSRYRDGSFSRDADYVPAWRDEPDLETVRNALPPDIPHEDVWITDFIGHDFVTIHTRQYPNIPRIFDTFTRAGFCMVTHSAIKVCFKPGESFTRAEFERKMVAQMRSDYEEWRKLRTREPNTWKVVVQCMRVFPLLQHWNWASAEGKALCTEIRSALRKKSPQCKHQARMLWPKYAEVAARYGILHVGGWSAYDTGLALPPPGPTPTPPPAALVVVPVPMERSQDDEDEVLCMVCLSEPPDTIAQPCGHIVVCHSCSDQLAATETVNKKRCIQCQRPITHVEK